MRSQPSKSLSFPLVWTLLGLVRAQILSCAVVAVQEHYVLLLGGAIFLELAGAVLFLANYSAGAYMLVRCCICRALLPQLLFLPLSFNSVGSPQHATCICSEVLQASMTPTVLHGPSPQCPSS